MINYRKIGVRSCATLVTAALLVSFSAEAKIPRGEKSLPDCNDFASYDDIGDLLRGYESTYDFVRLTSAGQSIEGRELYTL